VFLWVGTNWQRKNGERVIRAFTDVRRVHPEAVLHLAGDHPPIEEPGVICHGYLSHDNSDQLARLQGLFRSATCFTMPSPSEPYGIVYLEAGAFGTPSIGGVRGGASYAIGGGGLLVDPEQDGAVEAAMLAMCDPGTAAEFGRRASEHSASLTWPNVAGNILAALG
jgi:glycosyltransferase involved in cell wall biosynthesis